MVTDPIADMLIRIKNGYGARKLTVDFPWSKIKETLAGVLTKNGYVAGSEIKEVDGLKVVSVTLKYEGKKPALTDLRRVSRPSLRIYANKTSLPRVLGGLGIAIISTPKGILTDKQARKLSVGGEVICEIW
jgi:small subunit ribosomal protein S8